MMLRRHHPKKPAESEVIDYSDLTVKELKDIAKDRNIEGYSTLNKEDLISVLEG
ncbi:Rho termination factor N-terminal domain-containing protein [uncultured Streptococcus sp.]|uniref:Rho termination factor N-terminal domain-containing protein n=1 Tax=uncultured Streptococcus sp. TaxID=83427 RepID=UPI00288A196D|nr:Rho termination factor N-terminal domain-containing protein [uncultured Streptococcus sp.]